MRKIQEMLKKFAQNTVFDIDHSEVLEPTTERLEVWVVDVLGSIVVDSVGVDQCSQRVEEQGGLCHRRVTFHRCEHTFVMF